jgi:hypothetical protein
METLLSDIRTFCQAYALPETRFGALVLNDTAFVHKLAKGRRLWPETEAKVRRFMATYCPDRAA